jgi:hypothetical protein
MKYFDKFLFSSTIILAITLVVIQNTPQQILVLLLYISCLLIYVGHIEDKKKKTSKIGFEVME